MKKLSNETKKSLTHVLDELQIDSCETITVGKNFELINLLSTIAIEDIEDYKTFAESIVIYLAAAMDLMYSIYSMTTYGFTLKYEGEI